MKTCLKSLLFILTVSVACLGGCATPRPLVMAERYAIVVSTSGLFGSGIILGDGYAIVSRHVISKDSAFVKFFIFSTNEVDSTATVILTNEDVVLIRTRIGQKLEKVRINDPKPMERIYWIQPHFSLNNEPPIVFTMSGIVSSRLKGHWTVDRPVYPGVSGSGVWNENSELIGMIFFMIYFDGGGHYGIFEAIPSNIRQRMEFVAPDIFNEERRVWP